MAIIPVGFGAEGHGLIEVVLGSAAMGAWASGRPRDTGLVWGVVAVACVATMLLVWIGAPATTDRSVLGRPDSLVVLAVVVMAAIVGAVASYVPRDKSRQLRSGVATRTANRSNPSSTRPPPDLGHVWLIRWSVGL